MDELEGRPEFMTLEDVRVLDSHTVSEVGAMVSWWFKTWGSRFSDLDKDVERHKREVEEKKEERKETARQRIKEIARKMRAEADQMEKEML